MHKLVRTSATLAALAVLFGTALSAHGQAAQQQPQNRLIFGPDYENSAQRPRDQAAYDEGVRRANELRQIPTVNALDKLTSDPIEAVADVAKGIGGSFVSWIGLKGLGYVTFALSYIAGYIGSTVFTLAGLFVEFGLYLNTTILDSSIVQLGWRFCRDLANLGFTVGIVVIAYATMLGYENYGIKKLIRNFVIAAVVVNFSFSIAGFLIDMSNMLTHFFVNASIGGGGVSGSGANIHKFAETLASAFSPQKLLVTDSGNFAAFESLADDGILAAVLGVFFVALFTAFCALGMLAVGLTTIWRFAHLSGLVIVMPMAILCYAFPKTQKHYNNWWGKFSCQLTYLPTATFFLYLVIMFVQIKASVGFETKGIDLKNLLDSFEQAKDAGGLTTTKTLALMAAPFQTLTDMVLVLTMLFLAIVEARKVGCSAGKIAIDGVEGLRDWVIGRGKYKFSEGRGAAGWAGSKFLSGGETPEGSRGTRLANFMSRVPIVSRFVPRLNNFAAGTKRRVGNFETEYKGLGDQQLINALYNPDIKINPERMAAAAKEAASRGLFSEDDRTKGVSQEKFAEFIPALRRYGMDEDVLKKMPQLYGKFGWNIAKDAKGEYINKEDGKKFDGIMKGLKAEDVENFPPEAFADSEVVKRLSGAHLEKLPKGDAHRKAFSDTLIRLRGEMGDTKFDEHMAKTFAKAESADALTPELLARPEIVRNLNNAHLKRFSSADKKKQRDAFLATINGKDPAGQYTFTDKELGDFMKKNFAKGKDIEDIHPDMLRNERIFGGLTGVNISQLQQAPDTQQQLAIIQTLRKEYLNNTGSAYEEGGDYSKTKTARLDDIAATIVKNKDNPVWGMVTTEEAKDDFRAIENEYRSRHPDETVKKKIPMKQQKKPDDTDPYGPSAPPTPPTPPPAPPTPPGSVPPPTGGGPGTGPKTNPPQNPPTGNAGGGTVTPPVVPQPPINGGQNASPSARPPVIDPDNTPATDAYPRPDNNPKPSAGARPDPAQTKKSTDIGGAVEAAFKNSPQTAPVPPATPVTPPQPAKAPSANELSDDYLASLEAATNPDATKAAEPEAKPITPPEIEKESGSADNQLSAPPKAEPDANATAKAAWSVNAKRKTLYEDLPKQGETPTVLKSAWEQLRAAERAYEKATGKELAGGRIPYERSAQYELEENKKLEVSGATPKRAPATWDEFVKQYGERGENLNRPPEPPQNGSARAERTNNL